ncbi:uncharacterized protein LOC124708137 [Lolium rigidum]|uniref:uncharacterized protein LOC124708137 n=1 Tax=Lolium rigidum TaxID=89674 RepID=UPI001F5C63C1|nr:uncharacterized protein LOC124708137 [Lolium rigidum]
MAAPSSNPPKANPNSELYELKEHLLTLTTMVAMVTYVSGLNLPGGVWEAQDKAGHLAGDPILRDMHYRRYISFTYCNATALTSSLVACLILFTLHKESTFWRGVLCPVMFLELIALMGSYAAGSCLDAFTTICALVLAFPVLAYITYGFLCFLGLLGQKPERGTSSSSQAEAGVTMLPTPIGDVDKDKNEVHMLLATFAITITYVAGLNPPGGFWSSSTTTRVHLQRQHMAGDPIMQDRGLWRYRAFFLWNTTAFVASLLIILHLLEKKLIWKMSRRFNAVMYVLISVALLCLMEAYAVGSCREAHSTVKVLSLAVAVPACVFLQLALSYFDCWKRISGCMIQALSGWLKSSSPAGTIAGEAKNQDQDKDQDKDLKRIRYFVMVLASLAVSITYQAGLDPPGGLWQDSRAGHKIGYPVLRTTHPTRYMVFFYSNSAAFVTSLVVVIMVQCRYLVKRRALLAAMVLDLIGLVIAYIAGSTREVFTSACVAAMGGLVLSCTVIHIALGGEEEKVDLPVSAAQGRSKDQLERKRQVMLIIAILVAALMYQAGLTPPGGFWPADNRHLGHRHRAGYPVLLSSHPRRYKAFFYCNAVSFMASVVLILLLVNRKLYRPAIRCYALHVCMAVGMLALMGAYTSVSGNYRHLKTSIYVLTLVAAVAISLLLQLVIFWYIRRSRRRQDHGGQRSFRGEGGSVEEQNEVLEYLMVLAVLIASVTYQSGLKPPGGIWQEDKDARGKHFSAGNPILHDISKLRYNVFFYSNSAAFMASIIVMVTLLPLTLSEVSNTDVSWKQLWPVNMVILTDVLALLLAYATGSTRNLKSSRNVLFLVLPVLVYVPLHAGVAALKKKLCKPTPP